MTKGYLTFDTPEDYLAYQDKLIENWKKSPDGLLVDSYLHRRTGRTYAALTAAVEFAAKGDTTAFVYPRYDMSTGFEYHPVVEYYKDKIANQKLYLMTVSQISSPPRCVHYILDHTVFEMCKPSQLEFIWKTPAKQKIKYVKEIRMSPNSYSAVTATADNVTYEVKGDTLEIIFEYN